MARDEAISTLQAYTFTGRQTLNRSDVYRLVRLTTRSWVQIQQKQSEQVTVILRHLVKGFPWPIRGNRNVGNSYLPHAHAVLEFKDEHPNKNAYYLYNTGLPKGVHC